MVGSEAKLNPIVPLRRAAVSIRSSTQLDFETLINFNENISVYCWDYSRSPASIRDCIRTTFGQEYNQCWLVELGAATRLSIRLWRRRIWGKLGKAILFTTTKLFTFSSQNLLFPILVHLEITHYTSYIQISLYSKRGFSWRLQAQSFIFLLYCVCICQRRLSDLSSVLFGFPSVRICIYPMYTMDPFGVCTRRGLCNVLPMLPGADILVLIPQKPWVLHNIKLLLAQYRAYSKEYL